MGIRDIAACNKSLDNDYGATAGPNAAASHELHLFAGDPEIPEVEGGGVQLAGYTPPLMPNNGTSWPTAAAGAAKTSAAQEISFTADVAQLATHWCLKDPDTGRWWDAGRFLVPVPIVAGTTALRNVTVAYGRPE